MELYELVLSFIQRWYPAIENDYIQAEFGHHSTSVTSLSQVSGQTKMCPERSHLEHLLPAATQTVIQPPTKGPQRSALWLSTELRMEVGKTFQKSFQRHFLKIVMTPRKEATLWLARDSQSRIFPPVLYGQDPARYKCTDFHTNVLPLSCLFYANACIAFEYKYIPWSNCWLTVLLCKQVSSKKALMMFCHLKIL